MNRIITAFAKYGLSLFSLILLALCAPLLLANPSTLLNLPIPSWFQVVGIIALIAFLGSIYWLSVNAKFFYREQQVDRLFPISEWTNELARFIAWDIRMNRAHHCLYLRREETEELKWTLKMFKEYSLQDQISHLHEINRIYQRRQDLRVRWLPIR